MFPNLMQLLLDAPGNPDTGDWGPDGSIWIFLIVGALVVAAAALLLIVFTKNKKKEKNDPFQIPHIR